MRPMFTRTFWFDVAERAIKSAAQMVLVGLALSDSGPVNGFGLDWGLGLGFAAGGAVASVLTSVASAPVGGNGTASLVPAPPGPVATEE